MSPLVLMGQSWSLAGFSSCGSPPKSGSSLANLHSVKPHHLEKAHLRNIVVMFNDPLNFSGTPKLFQPNKWALFLSLLVIRRQDCVCICVWIWAWQTGSLVATSAINSLCPLCRTGKDAELQLAAEPSAPAHLYRDCTNISRTSTAPLAHTPLNAKAPFHTSCVHTFASDEYLR